jgi:5'-nucleotidase
MLRRRSLLALVIAGALWASAPSRAQVSTASAATSSITFAHFNDVYEIDAVENGASGGLARLATALDRLRRASGPVVTTLGGDFLSPSALGTAVVDGEPLAGRQMVDVLNTLGLQWATLGNHEFDLSEAAFHKRLAEAKFKVVVSNATDAAGNQFANTAPVAIVSVSGAGGPFASASSVSSSIPRGRPG